ncbi:hypothetical protein JCM3775_005152 [Rhodotorula graminis]
MLDIRPTRGSHPRTSLPALPSDVLVRVVRLAVPLTDDDEFEPWNRARWLHDIARTCRALYRAAAKERSRLVVLRNPTTLDGASTTAKYLRIHGQDRPCDLSKLAQHVKSVRSLRLYLDPATVVDLSALAGLPNFRHLTISGGTLSATDPDRLPTNLVELELLDLKCAPALADSLIRRNTRLNTAHLTPLTGDDGQFVPGEALATLEHLKFLQYAPTDRVDDAAPFYESLLDPFAARLVDSLVLVYNTECRAPVDAVKRLIVHYPVDDADLESRSELPDQLARLAQWIKTASRLESVALPGTWHPNKDLDDPYERGVQLASNSVMNACVARRIRVTFCDLDEARPRGASAAPLCDEVRTGRSSVREIVALREPLDEWPGSWARLLADEEDYGDY